MNPRFHMKSKNTKMIEKTNLIQARLVSIITYVRDCRQISLSINSLYIRSEICRRSLRIIDAVENGNAKL